MAILFSEDFSGTDWSAWNQPPSSRRAGPFAGSGCGGGQSNTCNSGPSISFGALGTLVTAPGSGVTTCAIRMQYGLFASAPFTATEFPWVMRFADSPAIPFSDIENTFAGTLVISDSGTVSLTLSNSDTGPLYPAGPSFNSYDSASGVFPLDGSIHGIQVALTISTTIIGFTVVIDDVVVIAGSHTAIGNLCAATFGYFTLFNSASMAYCPFFVQTAGVAIVALGHYRSPTNTAVPADVMSNCSEFIVDSSASIISYPACGASPISADTCGGPGPRLLSVPRLFYTPYTTVLRSPTLVKK